MCRQVTKAMMCEFAFEITNSNFDFAYFNGSSQFTYAKLEVNKYICCFYKNAQNQIWDWSYIDFTA